MTTMQTVLGFYDFFIIGMIVLCFAGASYVKGPDVKVQILVRSKFVSSRKS